MAKKTVITPPVTLVGSILTCDEIISHGIIVFDNPNDNDPECFDNTSYNLRLGEKYYKPKIDDVNIIGEVTCAKEYPGCPYHKQALDGVIGNCNSNNRVLVIKPYTSVVISTLERLNLPNNVVGRFDLKIRWALQGLILQVGTQIAPGYTGRLFGLLHNLSNKDICIPMKIGILDVEFSYTYKSVTPQKYDETYNTIEGFLKNRPPIVGTLEAFLEEIKKEKKEMTDLKNQLEKDRDKSQKKNIQFWSIFGGIAATFIIALITIVVPISITKITVDKDDYPFQKVYEMETENKQMYLKIDSLLKENKQTSDSLNRLGKRINELEKKNGKKK